MQAFLEGLEEVDEDIIWDNENCYALNNKGELTHLDIANSDIIDFEAISKNTSLIIIWLRSNNITEIPQSMKKLVNLDVLFLGDNPITKNIQEIEDQLSPQELITYLLEVQDKDTTPLNEAKILVVGDERVGKPPLSTACSATPTTRTNKAPTALIYKKTILALTFNLISGTLPGRRSPTKPISSF